MYAVIESGGKQYRVELGSEIQVDRIDASPGDTITLERVLLVADGDAAAVGRPVVDGAVVSAEVVGQDRGDKVVVFKYKPKARRRVKKGHRAELTTLRIADIAYAGRSAAKEESAATDERARGAEAAREAASAKAAADQELAARLSAQTRTTQAESEAAPVAEAPADPIADAPAEAAPAVAHPEAEVEAAVEGEAPSGDAPAGTTKDE